MAISEQRAKDLANIEPPSSIGKIVQFTEQLSFGQDALFSGSELPVPPIARHSADAAGFAQTMADRPYSLFPGANGEGLDALMTRYSLKGRDVQDFTRWLRRWEDARSTLRDAEPPELTFADRTFEPTTDIGEIVRSGRRRRRAVREVEEPPEVVTVLRPRKRTTLEVEAPSPSPGAAADRPAPAAAKAAASAPAAESFDAGMMAASLQRGLLISNIGLGGLTGGVIRGQADAAASFQAQEAAAQAVQASPAAPYMEPGQLYYQQPARFPPPEVVIHQIPGGPPIEVRSDWPGGSTPMPGRPDDYVLVPREVADERIPMGVAYRPSADIRFGAFPGTTGFASRAFAGGIAGHAFNGLPPQIVMPAYAQSFGSMPAGTLTRRDVFDGGPREASATGFGEQGAQPGIPSSPLLGQITLISPPLHVGSERSERAGSVVAFDTREIGKGMGPLDASGLAMLQRTLPPGARAIYPALPPGSLGPQAVNLRLAPSLLTEMLTQGYGPQAGAAAGGIAAVASAMPLTQAGTLQASLVPSAQRPVDGGAGVLGADEEGPGALKHAGAAGAGRGGALDFLGMPVRLAPSLSGSADVKNAAEARTVLPAGAAAVMRPNEFGEMRTKLLPHVQTLHAEPDRAAWQKAAPSFGLRDAEPHTLLSPDSRIKPPAAGAPIPQMQAGGGTLQAQALHGAIEAAPAVAAASGKIPGGEATLRASTASPAGSQGPDFHPPALGLAHSAPGGIGSFKGFSPGSIGPASISLTAATAAASGSSRVLSRFSPTHPSIGTRHSRAPRELPGLGERPSMAAEKGTPGAHPSSPIAMSRPGAGLSPKIPRVHPVGEPAMPTGSSGEHPAQARISRSTGSRIETSSATHHVPAHEESHGAPAMPVVQTPSVQSVGTSYTSRLPAMPIATSVAAIPRQQPTAGAVQRATSVGGAAAGSGSSGGEESTESKAEDAGASAHEVNLLANEVWSLLKRKLRFETERLGRSF